MVLCYSKLLKNPTAYIINTSVFKKKIAINCHQLVFQSFCNVILSKAGGKF